MSLKHVNVVVIGSGAGGGVVAKELAEAGLDVVLLERGRWITPDQDRKDDLRNQRTTVLGPSCRSGRRKGTACVREPRRS